MFNTERIDHIYEDPHVENQRFKLHYGDLTDSMNLTRIIQETQPDEIYNLAAMSHVAVSFETPEYTAKENKYTDCQLSANNWEAIRFQNFISIRIGFTIFVLK